MPIKNMKSINKEVGEEVINFIENSSFYNKIQITKKNESMLIETFYFMKEGIGHAILLEKQKGEVETIQEPHMVNKNFIYERLSRIEDGAMVTINGNSADYILSIKL